MNAQDKLERERNDARNSVEEYVYYMKDKLCEELREYVSPAVRYMDRITSSFYSEHFLQ